MKFLLEPPQVRNVEVIELDSENKTITVRWDSPLPPYNGILHHYSIEFCFSESGECDRNNKIIVRINEFCELWEQFKNSLCKTITLPSLNFDKIMVNCYVSFD